MVSLAKYTIEREIQRSADVVLYAGRRTNDQIPVILKAPRNDPPTPRQIAGLRHELAILKDLPIPGVLAAHSLEVEEDGVALVLEGFAGEPLHDVTRARRLELHEILQIAVSIAGTLAGIHDRNVIHGGLQPDSILLDATSKEIKLIDFSAASRLAGERRVPVSPNALEGSLAYLSPEQTGRMNRAIDRRADLYSLGVILYELLTGDLPFATTDPMELVHCHIARTPASPREVGPGGLASRALDSELPAVVSDIVMKLLAKAAEDRYRSAAGLSADLAACLASLQESGDIKAFPLGQEDRSAELVIPERLYGLSAELGRLSAAFDRVAGGAAEILLVSGASGAGKSTLVHEIHKCIAAGRGGHFAAGRFEQHYRGMPHAPLMEPFREICRLVLEGRPEVLADYRVRLESALSHGGQVLIDVIPELVKIIGPQQRVPALGPTEAQNRFTLLFQSMVRVFATPEYPLILFLDDLQWADPAAVRLLQAILSDPESAHLLVIGAFCDDEVGDGHPLRAAVRELERIGVTTTPIRLGPLSAADTAELIADTLGDNAEGATELAAFVFEKTRGNRLFARWLLRSLHEDKLLSRGPSGWTMDLAVIREAPIPDDLIALMARRIERLPQETARALELAACIGHVFDLRTLAVISERTQRDLADVLWSALEKGLVLPISDDYRLIHAGWDAAEGEAPASIRVSYRFMHECVQKAAYARLREADRQPIHLAIGKLLQRDLRDEDQSGLFDVVRHLNLSAALIADQRSRLDLVRMNLTAGLRAKSRGAYATAAGYFEAGAAILPDAGWVDEHDLAFSLHAEQAECEVFGGRFERALPLFDVLLSRARGSVEIARVHGLSITLHTAQGKVDDALRAGRKALSLLGIEVPEDAGAAADHELAEVSAKLKSHPIDDLLDAPELTSPELRAALRLLMALTMPAALTSPPLYTFVVAKQVNISLTHGHSDVSAYGYMAYGWIAARVLSRYEDAHALGRLALDLNERFNNPDLTCKLNFMFGAYIDFYTEHLRSSVEYLRRAQQAGLRSFDFQYLSYACRDALILRLSLGDDCMTLREEIERSQALLLRLKDELSIEGTLVVRQTIANLMGATRGRHTLSDGTFDETSFEEKFSAPGHGAVALLYYTEKLTLAYLYEDYQGALRMALRCEERLAGSAGDYFATELVYYACLTLAAVIPSAPDEERRRYEARFAGHMSTLERWAKHSPENFRHKHLLVLAEQARTEGEELSAMKLYEQAIESAKKSEFVRDEALGNELSAKFYLMTGRPKIARLYMTDAYQAYQRWGASSKVEQILEKYPSLVAQASPRPTGSPRVALTSVRPERADGLDLLAVTRAARSISSEMLLDKLVDRLLRILIENAGAQRGVLVLSRDGRLMVEAMITMRAPSTGGRPEPERVDLGAPAPIEAGDALPAAIARYVARTCEPVVLRDATADDRFSGDPYITERRPKSIMCLAMTHQGRLTGVLYLEHNAIFGAFGPTKLELCDLLASHAAIAVENAILYGHVQEATSALQQTNEVLEDEVKRRTEELRSANERLLAELITRKRIEEERALFQEEVIRVQRDRLLELSTPLIPITDEIMVLPLIGEVDPARSMQVMEATLAGVQSHRAKVVIMDVTGAKGMNDEVASALVRTSNAVRLLGARVVLTGLRPQAARTLVELGVDLGGVATLGTLKDAIIHALRLTGRGVHGLAAAKRRR